MVAECVRFLDLDDKTGKDSFGRWVAVVYLSENNQPGRNFNKMLVDAGHAVIEDFKNSEFDPGLVGYQGPKEYVCKQGDIRAKSAITV